VSEGQRRRRPRTGGETTSNLDQFLSNLSAHEMGHKLGLPDIDRLNQNDKLMFAEHTSKALFRSQTVPCKLSNKE
jgi:hypothetical protein